jgi:hypothetical protein
LETQKKTFYLKNPSLCDCCVQESFGNPEAGSSGKCLHKNWKIPTEALHDNMFFMKSSFLTQRVKFIPCNAISSGCVGKGV